MGASVLCPTIFRRYDIRGIVDECLTEEGMFDIGRGFGSELRERNERQIIVARDARLSSPAFAEALTRGLISAGIQVFNLGAIATPVAHFAAQRLQIPNTAVVTGSHNPSNYNGVKLSAQFKPFHREQLQALCQRIIEGAFTLGTGQYSTIDVTVDYQEAIVTQCSLARPLRIALDCGNGIAGITAADTLRKLGCEVAELYCDPQGEFPNHHPNPSDPKNLVDLQNHVVSERLDAGIALDGDGDRMGLIDSEGNIIWPDRQMMLFARSILDQNSGATIVFDVKSTSHLPRVIEAAGGVPVMFKSGSSLLREKMEQDDLVFGGELSGHLFFRDRWFGFDDGLYTAARMLELLSRSPKSSCTIFSELPDSINTPEITIDFPSESELQAFMTRFQAAPLGDDVVDIHRIDGVRLDYEDGWGLVRASNTTPALSVRFEASNEQALHNVQQAVAILIHQVDASLKLPFPDRN